MNQYKKFLGRADLVKNQVEREKLAEQEATSKRKRSIQQQNKQRWLKYQEQLRSELAARYFHSVISVGGEESFSNTKSLSFDGSNDFVQSDATYSKLDGQTKASFSVWLKPTSSSGRLRTVFQIGDGSGSGINGVCQLFLFENVRIDFSVDFGSYYGRADISGITYGSWNHLLITVDFDATPEFKCYVNGVDATTSDNLGVLSVFPNATQGLMIGEWHTGHYAPFLGGIDEFAIWSGVALTSTDATSLYNSGPNNLNDSNVVATAPTTWYRMGDGDTFPTITDNGSGGSNATMQNMDSADIVEDTPG